jgi:hypothetical protein
MNREPSQPRPKIAVEDLLRVKRAERPAAEFWTRFESELRAKQLAAIVEKRPWWHGLSRLAAGSARLQLSLGATAVFALSVFVVREYRRPAADNAADGLGGTAPVASMIPAQLTAPAVAKAAAPGTEMVMQPVPVSNVRPGEISQVISMLGTDSHLNDTSLEATPSARFIAANRAMAQMIEPDLLARFEVARGFETRALPARPTETEPLAQISTPKDRMNERYLSRSLPVAYALESSTSRPSEPVRSRVKDRQLLDDSSGSRFGYDNGSFNLKLF